MAANFTVAHIASLEAVKVLHAAGIARVHAIISEDNSVYMLPARGTFLETGNALRAANMYRKATFIEVAGVLTPVLEVLVPEYTPDPDRPSIARQVADETCAAIEAAQEEYTLEGPTGAAFTRLALEEWQMALDGGWLDLASIWYAVSTWGDMGDSYEAMYKSAMQWRDEILPAGAPGHLEWGNVVEWFDKHAIIVWR